MESLRAERTDLEHRVADLTLQAESSAGILENRRRQLAALEDELTSVHTNCNRSAWAAFDSSVICC